MPIYEYLCLDCKKPVSFLVWMVADSGEPECTRCGGKKLRKIISRIARARSKEASLVNLADPSKLGDMEDPRAMACWAKEMGKSLGDETGEDLGDFDEMMENPPGKKLFSARSKQNYLFGLSGQLSGIELSVPMSGLVPRFQTGQAG